MDEQAIALAYSSGIDLEILRERIVPRLNEQYATPIKSYIRSPSNDWNHLGKPDFDFDDVQKDLKQEIKRGTISTTKYNLRGRRKRRKCSDNVQSRTPYWFNSRTPMKCYRDRVLQCVDVDRYHNIANRDENTTKLLDLFNKVLRSQIDTFTYNLRTPFFIVSWLTSVRVFEYRKDKKFYFEAKRLPRRYFDLNSDLITCVHYCDGKVYASYIGRNSKSYLEIRDLFTSQLVLEPYHYGQAITGIKTDCNFVYINTSENIIHLHNRKHFLVQHFIIDLSTITTDAVIDLRAQVISTHPYTKLNLCIVTTRHLITTKFDVLEHLVSHKYYLGYYYTSQYTTKSSHHIGTKVLVHRNLTKPENTSDTAAQSVIEVGSLLSKRRSERIFLHERSLSFSYHIIQIEQGCHDNIFVFGRTKGKLKKYEIACMNIKNFKPIWCTQVVDAEDSTKILVQEDHLILFKDRQRYTVLQVDLSPANSNNCVICGVKVAGRESAEHDQHPRILCDLKLQMVQT